MLDFTPTSDVNNNLHVVEAVKMGRTHCQYSNKGKGVNVKKKNRGPKRGTKTKLKVRPGNDVKIENIEMLSKEQLKKVVKNPRNSIRPSGKRKRKVLKRLRHNEKEKTTMQVETDLSESTSKIKSKTPGNTSKTKFKTSKMETEHAEDSDGDVDMVE